VAEAVGGFSSLTPSGTSVLLEGELAQTPEGTKQASLACLNRTVLPLPFSIELWGLADMVIAFKLATVFQK